MERHRSNSCFIRPLLAVVLLAPVAACRRAPAIEPGQIAVLFSRDAPEMAPRCPAGRCTLFALEGFACPDVRAAVVLVGGHAVPPLYAGHRAAELATAIACFHPDLVVIDMCYGASTPILDALAAAGQRPLIVAPPFKVPSGGLFYPPEFFATATAEERAKLPRTRPPFPLLRWRLDPPALDRARAEVATLHGDALVERRRRAIPCLVRAPLASPLAADGEVLVLLAPDRCR